MKNSLLILFVFSFCALRIVAQTNATVPGPEHVLVVYKLPDPNNPADTLSQAVKNYYQQVRGIPTINILPLNNLISQNININGDIHTITIAEGENIIRDVVGHNGGSWFVTQHAWKYFYQYVALPIKNYITSNNLTSIRYIVLCKGVPFKIQAGGDSAAVIGNLAIDGLLSMLNTNNYDILLDSIYNKYRRYALPDPNYCYACQSQISNPYYNADQNLNMNNRFLPGVFTRNWNGHTIKLDYLVSHLDGISYNMVKGIIDLSSQAIHSDNYDWFIDADPEPCRGGSIMVNFANSAASKLSPVGFSNYSFDVTEDTNTYHIKPVMSYSSNGIHTTLGPYSYPNCANPAFSPDYIQSTLKFTYAPGSIFNTAESFNAHLLSSISRRPGAEMGQVVEFFLKGGTVGVGHAYEPFTFGIIDDGIMFPSYQVGYSFIDAAYMGMPYLAWQNVVIGDPLTTIAWGKQTLTQNLTWSSTNLVTGEVTIPSGKTLTIQNNSTIRLRHQGIMGGAGILNIGSNVTVNTNDWSRSVLLSNSGLNPRLVWAAHPSFTTTNFKVYRAISSSQVSDPSTLSYQLIYTSANSSTFSFTDPDIMISTGSYVYYYVTAFNLINPRTGYGVESGRSNYASVRGDIYKRSYETAARLNQELDYTLGQNYPNPFNPKTQIRYSLKEDGFVTLKLYDILGNEITTLVSEPKSQGNYTVDFETANLSSGVYIYQLKINNYIASKKMIISK